MRSHPDFIKGCRVESMGSNWRSHKIKICMLSREQMPDLVGHYISFDIKGTRSSISSVRITSLNIRAPLPSPPETPVISSTIPLTAASDSFGSLSADVVCWYDPKTYTNQ